MAGINAHDLVVDAASAQRLVSVEAAEVGDEVLDE